MLHKVKMLPVYNKISHKFMKGIDKKEVMLY